MRMRLTASLFAAVIALELSLLTSVATAITAGPGLLNYAAPMRGRCLQETTPENTIDACRAALSERTPSEDRPKIFLALARAYGALRQTESALQAYDAVVRLEPGNYEALAAGCWIRGLLNTDLDRALNECQLALGLDPDDAQIIEDRCLVYFRMGNYAQADADCSGAATFPLTASHALYLRGLVKIKKGDSAGGGADIGAAKRLQADVADDFAADGLTP